MRKAALTVLLLIILTLPLASCASVKNDKLQVYTSFYIVYDFATKIAGNYADVYCLTPFGAEAHDWEPTPKDMARIEQAGLLLYLNPNMETWVTKVKASVKNTPAIMIAETLESNSLDPHIWLSPVSVLELLNQITDALIKYDSVNEAGYKENLTAAEGKLNELDLAYKNAGLEGKTIVTDHAAYGRLCEAYGMTQLAVDANNSGSDVSAARMAEIIEYIKENNINYVFCGEYSNQSIIDIIAKESGAEKLFLNPCEGLSEEQQKNNEDYFSVMYKNLDSLIKGAQ